MPDLMWCPNCKQPVAPQKKKSNKGTVVLLLLLIGIAVFIFGGPFGWVAAIIIWIVGALILVFGLVSEIAALATKPTCPICKASNLLKEQPKAVEQAQ